jgi:hypothetical protein
MLDKYCDDVQEQVKNQYGFTIPWDILLEVAIDILRECLDEYTLVDGVRTPTRIQRAAITVAIKREGYRGYTARKIRDAMIDQAQERSDAELLAGYGQANNVFGMTMAPVEDEE